MPIIKSAIKKVKQDKVKTDRNKSFKSKMLTMFKNIQKFVSSGKKDTAVSFASEAYSVIDTAAKKNIIHKNNASRKKSTIAKMIKDTPFPAMKSKKSESVSKTESKSKTGTKKTATKK